MLRRLLPLAVLLLGSSVAQAQIFAIHFNDEKHVRKYKGNVIYWNGEPVLVGESRKGIDFDPDQGTLKFDPQGNNEIYVADPSDPLDVPYKWNREGEKEAKSSRNVAVVQGPKISRVSVFIRDDTLAGLAREYQFRLDRVEELIDERDDAEKGSETWFALQGRVITALERLHSWLDKTAYPDAAAKLEPEVTRERKKVSGTAAQARLERVVNSVGEALPPPQSLVAASEKLTEGRLRFKVMESEHLRITYLDRLSDGRVNDLLEFGERLIDAYRVEFVDPYRSEEFPDNIPDKIFQEFWFGPEDLNLHENFLIEHYGLGWNEKRKQELLDSGSVRFAKVRGLTMLNYNKLGEGSDLEGRIAHMVGHAVAMLHYGKGETLPDWLEEASAYYCSFELLGRNTVTCFQFKDTRYLEPDPGEEGEKTVQRGLRQFFNELALAEGPKLSALAIMSLFEMEDPDFAKSWSMFDYVARKEGLEGQLFLRACGEAGTVEEGMLAKWRTAAETIFDVTGKDVFQMIEEQWRKFAERGQDKGDKPRRRS